MHILLTGASGLLGQGVLTACLADPGVERVTLLARRPLDRRPARTRELQLKDFALAGTLLPELHGIDACFYCAGAAPIGTAEDAYRRVTLDLTLSVARAFAAANPQGRFLYVSGANSNPSSHLMPLRIKGETEVALQQLPVTTVMLRPGGILPDAGTQSPHSVLRLLHTLARPLQGALVNGLPSAATTNGTIGRAMLALARMPAPPAIVENREINHLAPEHR